MWKMWPIEMREEKKRSKQFRNDFDFDPFPSRMSSPTHASIIIIILPKIKCSA